MAVIVVYVLAILPLARAQVDQEQNTASSSQLMGPDRHGWEVIPNDDAGLVGNEDMTIVMGLRINFDSQIFKNMFDPSNPSFRNFHSYEESRALATEGLEFCSEKLQSDANDLGLTLQPMTMHYEYFEVTGTGQQILNLFRKDTLVLKRFENPHANYTIVRALFYEELDIVDDLIEDGDLRACIGMVLRLVDFPRVRRPPTPTRDEWWGHNGSPQSITPHTLSDMYGVPLYPANTSGINATGYSLQTVQAVYESDQVQVSSNDLQSFNSEYGFVQNSLTGDYEGFNTDSCGDGCMEPNLDVQYLSGMNQGIDVEYVAVQTMSEAALDGIRLESNKLPYVVSVSWGEEESPYVRSNLIHTCRELGTLSARGVTFFASAGDQGATNSKPCGTRYNVNFPASCPFVTAVGATTGFKATEEVVCNAGPSSITTGGGFSAIFNEQSGFDLSFQSDQVESYRASLGSQLSGSLEGYPGSGSRGLPDISAPGTNYVVKIDGSNTGVDGTSCSSPVMAGITARVMLSSGGKRFGCINPILYKSQDIFFDVVSGQNSGDGQDTVCGYNDSAHFGFAATKGWDAASGLGTLGTADGAFPGYYKVLSNTTFVPEYSSGSKNVGLIVGASIAAVVVLAGIAFAVYKFYFTKKV